VEKVLRDALQGAVATCRVLLERDYREQLEGVYGVLPSGEVQPLTRLPRLDTDTEGRALRGAIEAALLHEQAQGYAALETVSRFVRAAAYTTLNRLAALKLMETESRRIARPSIGGGRESAGFQAFQRVSGSVANTSDGGYPLYLGLLCDDLAVELGELFDRRQAAGRLFPSPPCLDQVLSQLNAPALAPAWDQDETIGWVYQYFTPAEQRRQARTESRSGPRNSEELAFLNQFFTPRYVVQFLVDNTLGRMWYEMRQGETALAERCTYLITEPGDPIPEREERDPRQLRILDPACGSGHFLLYSFDLLETIYEETYEEEDSALRKDFPSRADFQRAVPGLIIRHNLHGVDIDARACQLAGLALWQRAQRRYQQLGLGAAERPRLTRSHIVCAEPMPGEVELLEEFVQQLQPTELRDLVRAVFEQMRLGGEAGTLLRVEAALRDAIAREMKRWLSRPSHEQGQLWPDASTDRSPLGGPPTEADFWDAAERRTLEALREYAERAANGHSAMRRLFAEDAVQGFALVDLMRRRFDIVLMNPPFGASSRASKAYIDGAYPRTKHDLYAAFVERGLELLHPGGLLGAITSRTGFFLTTFQRWREELLLGEARLIALGDLGQGVLDTAMVETAAYCLERLPAKAQLRRVASTATGGRRAAPPL
jgi:hypothetical protein